MSTNALQVVDVAAELPAVFELAKQLVPSGFLPDHIKTPGQAVAIILAGRELGMPPMRSLRSLVMVKGKVVEAADSQLARFKGDGGKAVFRTLTDDEAVLELTHPNGDQHVERFAMADAKRAGLTSNPTWAKYPRAMLRSRVITAGLKSIGWDGAVGNYDPDEAREIGPVPNAKVEPVVQMPRRKGEAAASLTPPVEPEPEEAEMQADSELHEQIVAAGDDDIEALLQASVDAQAKQAEARITEADRRYLEKLRNDNGHDRDDVKRWLARRGFQSSKDITVSAFGAIRDRLSDPSPLGD